MVNNNKIKMLLIDVKIIEELKRIYTDEIDEFVFAKASSVND